MRRKREVKILYKDQDIAVCEKPAGMPTADDKSGHEKKKRSKDTLQRSGYCRL